MPTVSSPFGTAAEAHERRRAAGARTHTMVNQNAAYIHNDCVSKATPTTSVLALPHIPAPPGSCTPNLTYVSRCMCAREIQGSAKSTKSQYVGVLSYPYGTGGASSPGLPIVLESSKRMRSEGHSPEGGHVLGS
jgi:hypothetical protein